MGAISQPARSKPGAAETLRGRGIGLAEFLEQFRLLRQPAGKIREPVTPVTPAGISRITAALQLLVNAAGTMQACGGRSNVEPPKSHD
jgi:hypothetical protein